jgi:hypothetical protein
VRLVRHPEKRQGTVLGYLHGKSVGDRPSCIEDEAGRIKRGAHSYRRRETATRRDPQREADIMVETLNKYQASD